ncbi:MAG: hypothetical protein QOJ69_20 [Actinomycetota bacterium]|jgi:hypothetical protein|nr:hypothetical protein [Actinomycetota bacterium]
MSDSASESKAERAESVERMLDDDEAPESETPKTSDSPGSATAPGAENVGDQDTQRGEDVSAEDGKEAGREDAGTKGATNRPVGTSDARDTTGVDPQEPITGSPPMGGQGG